MPRLVADGKMSLGSVQAESLIAPNVRTVAVVRREHFQLDSRRSSRIEGLRDLAGKRLALPPAGTSGNQNFYALAQHHDLPLSPRSGHLAGPVNDNFAALGRGEVDAIAFVRALRDPATIEAMRRIQKLGDSPHIRAR